MYISWHTLSWFSEHTPKGLSNRKTCSEDSPLYSWYLLSPYCHFTVIYTVILLSLYCHLYCHIYSSNIWLHQPCISGTNLDIPSRDKSFRTSYPWAFWHFITNLYFSVLNFSYLFTKCVPMCLFYPLWGEIGDCTPPVYHNL